MTQTQIPQPQTPYPQTDYLPVSQLNKYVFCPRRFYYEFVLGEWQDNLYTLAGTYRHDRAHTPGRETRPTQTTERSLAVFSDRLRITGKLDVVETRGDELIPVEYKSGAAHGERPWRNDAVQLCALALCLEERSGKTITRGALFTFEDKVKREVALDAELREDTEQVIAQAHATAASGQIPAPVYSPRCEGCSLHGICLPREVAQLRGGVGRADDLETLAELTAAEKETER